jgi:hypothetical protein
VINARREMEIKTGRKGKGEGNRGKAEKKREDEREW